MRIIRPDTTSSAFREGFELEASLSAAISDVDDATVKAAESRYHEAMKRGATDPQFGLGWLTSQSQRIVRQNRKRLANHQ